MATGHFKKGQQARITFCVRSSFPGLILYEYGDVLLKFYKSRLEEERILVMIIDCDENLLQTAWSRVEISCPVYQELRRMFLA